MIRGSWVGSLSLATARPGILVRCTQLPSEYYFRLWDRDKGALGFDFVPSVAQLYAVRGISGGPSHFVGKYKFGIVLAHKDTRAPLRNSEKVVVSMRYEPYFPFECFDIAKP